MIRLAILGAKTTRWQEIAPRLRGIELELSPTPESLSRCEAAAFFGPHPVEWDVIERWLEAGKHALVAADACLSAERLQTLSSLARQAKVHLAVANLDRYLPSRQLIRQQLDAGKLGKPGLVRVHRWESATAEERGEPLGLAGALLRDLDLVLWFFGKAPNLIYALASTANGLLQVHLGFPSGGMALLDHAQRLTGSDGYYALTVIGAAGAAYVDDHQNMQLAFKGGRPQGVPTEEGVLPWSAMVQEFVDKIVGQDSNPVAAVTGLESCTPMDWHNALVVGAAVQRSLQTRAAVVPEGLH